MSQPAAGSRTDRGEDPGASRRRTRLVQRALAAAARRGGPVEKEILGLAEVVGPGGVCLDVGAEFGLYSHVLADLVGEGGVVHAFEPQRGARRWLALGVLAAGASWVHVHDAALGADPGHATLSVPRRRGLAVHGRAFVTTGARDEGANREFTGRRTEAVRVSTVDEQVAALGLCRLDLVKVDVEGAESAVLDGARHTLAAHRPALLLEIEDRHTEKFGVGAADILRRLQDTGYVAHVWADRWSVVDSLVPGERNYLFRS